MHTSSTTHQRTGRGGRHQSMLQCTWGHAWPLHQMVSERSGPCRYVMMQAGCKWERESVCVCVCACKRERMCAWVRERERVCIGVCACACWHERERHCLCFIKAIALFNGGEVHVHCIYIGYFKKPNLFLALSYAHSLSLKAFLSCTCVCVCETETERKRVCVCERECVYDYETDTH